MEYIPGPYLLTTIVISIGAGFILGSLLSKQLSLSNYLQIILQLAIAGSIFPLIHYGMLNLYEYLTGYTPNNSVPSTSITPNIVMYPDSPLHIPTTPGSKEIIPSTGTTATQRFGTSCLISINTVPFNPANGSENTQSDFAPLVRYKAITAGSNKPGNPVLDIGYLPEGNLLQAIFYEGGTGDSVDIPAGSLYDTRVTIGTPPIKKKVSLFIKTKPAKAGYTTVEIYINGVLGKSVTIRSLYFGSSTPGGIIPSIGYNASPTTYPVVDGEVQSILVWGDASGLTQKDIYSLSNQYMNTQGQSRHTDTTRCK